MAVTIEAIKFDHDRTKATIDALTIRKNAGQNIRVPEWERQARGNPLTSPAAYARSQGNNLTIAVQLRRTSISSDGTVLVSAQGGGVLGSVGEDTVVFPAQVLVSDFKVFNLVGATIGQASVGKHEITWNWSLRPNGAGPTQQPTAHEIYTLLDLPKAPWGQAGSLFPGFQVPWTDALDWACKWASGATTPDEAADKISREIYGLGQTKVQFDIPNKASSHFTIPKYRTFKCTKFLKLLGTATTTKALVNCTDCAVFVSSFVNILGGDLNQSRMGSNFNTNRILEIGLRQDVVTKFSYHEVAWKSPSNANAPLFDSSLQVDAIKPTDNYFESPMLGIAIPLGAPGTNYHFHLVAPFNSCQPLPGTSIRRKIDGAIVSRRHVVPEVEHLLKEEYDFSSWEETRTSDEHIFVWHFSQNRGGLSPAGWTSQSTEHFEGRSGAPDVTESIWTTDKQGAVLRELTYECDSLAEAHSLLLDLLDEFQLPGIKRRSNSIIASEQKGIGDVAFSGPDDVVLLFARANLVTLLQNERTAFLPASQFARDLDAHILSKPGSESEFIEMNRFRIAADKIQVGDEVRLQFIGEDPAEEVLYKFFSPSGEIYLRKDKLFYRASEAGQQLITIFALQAEQKTGLQKLSLVAAAATSDQTFLGLNSQNFNQRRKSMASIFEGSWSSIRPPEYGSDNVSSKTTPTDPLDLRRNGVFEIRSLNEATGEITGSYTDISDPLHPISVSLNGRVTFIGHGTYAFVLRHEEPAGSGLTTIYEGQIVASAEGDFPTFIVAGRFRRTPPTVNPANAVAAGQEEGVWVATKP
jgi:hypothetical protein